jgi:hypothetical protein
MNLTPFSRMSMLAALLLCGCAATPEAAAPLGPLSPWAADFAELRQGAEGQALLPIDAAASTLSVHVFRAGRAARLGHNHVLTAPKLMGWVRLPAGDLDLQSAGFELSLRLDELQLDAPAARAVLGAGWASALAPEMVAATRANMLGEAGLQAANYPLLRVRSLRISGAYPKLAALIEIELHGRRSQQWIALQAEVDGESVRARGALVLRQSDHGLTPFSVAGGLLAVQDELTIEFDLRARH